MKYSKPIQFPRCRDRGFTDVVAFDHYVAGYHLQREFNRTERQLWNAFRKQHEVSLDATHYTLSVIEQFLATLPPRKGQGDERRPEPA